MNKLISKNFPSPKPLPPAPKGIADANGQPHIGAFEGSLEQVDLSMLKGKFEGRFLDPYIRDKSFAFTAVSGTSDEGERVKLVMAIADLGYASTGFVTVYDFDEKKVLTDQNFFAGRAHISAEPKEGLLASYSGLWNRVHLSLSHPKGADSYTQHIDIAANGDEPSIRFDGTFGVGGPPPITVISPVIRAGDDEPSAAQVTVKSQALPGSGTLNVGGKKYHLDKLLAAIDYTSGIMNRETTWRWGSVTGHLKDGRTFGINLGEGFNESDPRANSNVLWVTGQDGAENQYVKW